MKLTLTNEIYKFSLFLSYIKNPFKEMELLKQKRVVGFLNILVLICSLAIVAVLSSDLITTGIYNPENPLMMQIQLVVCSVFLVDFFVRLVISERKWRFFGQNILLLLFSIPILNILNFTHTTTSPELHYMLGLTPVLRGGYGLIVIIRWITSHTIARLFISYMMIFVSVTYFASLLFLVTERGINPAIKDYWDALWWASMDVTTVGSNIIAVTPIGKVLSVMLAGLGMMMFPIFTVYITDRVTRIKASTAARTGNGTKDSGNTTITVTDQNVKTS